MAVSRRLRIAILERDGYRCVYCGRGSVVAILEVDHVVPRSAGGSDEPVNLVCACVDCNGGKGGIAVGLPDWTVVLRPMPDWYVDRRPTPQRRPPGVQQYRGAA